MSQIITKFEPGQLVVTPGALSAIKRSGDCLQSLMSRHLNGDWGDLDPDDKKANDDALEDCSRLFSAYVLRTDEKIWIITEAVGDDGKRASTCVLLPDEY